MILLEMQNTKICQKLIEHKWETILILIPELWMNVKQNESWSNVNFCFRMLFIECKTEKNKFSLFYRKRKYFSHILFIEKIRS